MKRGNEEESHSNMDSSMKWVGTNESKAYKFMRNHTQECIILNVIFSKACFAIIMTVLLNNDDIKNISKLLTS